MKERKQKTEISSKKNSQSLLCKKKKMMMMMMVMTMKKMNSLHKSRESRIMFLQGNNNNIKHGRGYMMHKNEK
jgi:hypothetical protein